MKLILNTHSELGLRWHDGSLLTLLPVHHEPPTQQRERY